MAKKNKLVVQELKNLSPETTLKVTIDLYKKCLLETCYHIGSKFEKNFSCESETTWRSATLVCEQFNVNELIDLLKSKNLSEIQDLDFPDLDISYTSDGDLFVTNVEWETPLTEEEECSEMDLYWDSDISDTDLSFGTNSIQKMTIELNNNIIAEILDED